MKVTVSNAKARLTDPVRRAEAGAARHRLARHALGRGSRLRGRIVPAARPP